LPDDTLTHPAAAAHAAPSAPSGPVPGKLIKLERWYLTLPVAEPGGDPKKAWNVYQNDGDLRTFTHERFRVRDGAVEYTAPVKGVSTPGSKATRSELREMTGPGRNDKAHWTLGKDARSLTCTLTCDPTSITGGQEPRRECIVGQIHGDPGTPPLYLAVDMNHEPGILQLWLDFDKKHPVTLLEGLHPDTRFSYRIESTKDGTCRIWAARGGVADLGEPKKTIPASKFTTTTKCFFKAGAYNKTEIKKGKDGASVVRHFLLEVR
jgi:hypothetical protein